MDDDWTTDIESMLENIRLNCVLLSKEHKKQFFYLKHVLQYFRLPQIILSGINSILSVGLQPYLDQGAISITTCLLALICSIIGSIELYLAIQKRMEKELECHHGFYLLGIDIFKNLYLAKEHRPIPSKEYLDKCYNEYIKLIEISNILSKKIEDKLMPLPKNIIVSHPTPVSSRTNLEMIVDNNIV